MRFKVTDNTRLRLDTYLAHKLPQLSRAFIQKLLKENKVQVNQEPSKPSYLIALGDNITVEYDLLELEKFPKVDLPIIYEDENTIVIDKPEGIITHARSSYHKEASVASFIRDRISGIEGERAGIVHRLDRRTSGVIICAKNHTSMSWLQKQFSQKRVKKTYIAIVSGHLKFQEAMIDMPIARNPKSPNTFITDPMGKSAQTHYKVIRETSKYTMLELAPKTGRTHQLRVHLSHMGHPIIGDTLYDGIEAERMMLHAKSLEIKLLNKDRSNIFSSPIPSIFDKFLDNDK